MLPEEFVKVLAEKVGKIVTDGVTQMLRDKPNVKYDVVRQTPQGPVATKVELSQILAELTDAMKVANDLARMGIQSTAVLVSELQEHRKLADKIRGRRSKAGDDERE